MSKTQSFEINLHNGSNTPISVSLEGVDSTGRLSFEGIQDNMQLAPDAKQVVQLQVGIKNRPLVGMPYILPFEVRISIDDLPPEAKIGQFEVQPLFPMWLLLLLPFLALCLIIIWLLISWPPEPPIEVTRVVREEVPVEVTRIKLGEVTKEVVVSKEVPVEVVTVETVEVTRLVTDTVDVEVTRRVTKTVEVEVTRVVVIYVDRPTPPTDGACTRIDLEVGRDKERGTHGSGIYEVRELSGNVIATWQAADGALDSGWIDTAFIADESVHVEVFFTPVGSDQTIQLEIIYPAPGTTFGWLTRGICHALEVQFPVG